MATIFERKNKDGTSSWRLMFRRKGIKPFITAFTTKEKAEEFARDYEESYVLKKEEIPIDRLMEKRRREFEFKRLK
jgi:hypothetical protein